MCFILLVATEQSLCFHGNACDGCNISDAKRTKEKALLYFHDNGYANAPQCYAIRTNRTLFRLNETAQHPKKGASVDKLIQTELVTKLPVSYGTSRFITMFKTAHRWASF